MCGSGTPSIHIGELNGQKSLNARRLMFLLACGQLDSFWLVHANCGDSRCINPEHLKAVRRVDLNRKVAKSRRYHGPAKKLAPQAWHP